MPTMLDALNIKPTDEKILTENPQFNEITESMEAKWPAQQSFEMTEFCLFRDENKLKEAVSILWENGFSSSSITTYTSHDGSLLDHFGSLKESKLGEGLLLGITVGIIGGGIFGVFFGYNFFTPFRTVPIPWFFSLLLSSVIWGFIGGVIGALVGRSIPEYKEMQYETKLPEGAMLVIVKSLEHDRSKAARRILNDHGGKTVNPNEIRKENYVAF